VATQPGRENLLGCWRESEFLAVLPSASPVTVATTAETVRNLLTHSEVSWWGDRFLIAAEVAYTVATAGTTKKKREIKKRPATEGQPGKLHS